MLRSCLILASVLVACSSDPVPLPRADATTPADATSADATPADAASADATAPSEDATTSVDASPADAVVAQDTGAGPAEDAGEAADSGVNAGDAGEAADVVVAPDSGEDDAGAAVDGAIAADATPDGGMGACVVDGVYSTNFFGMPVFFGFYTATGRWGAAEQLADLPANPAIAGPFSFAGGVLSLQEDPGSSCPPADVGAYAALFNATCTSFTLVVNTDPCAKRAMALNGAVFVR